MKTRVKKTCMAAALAGVVALAGASAHAQQPGTLTVLRVADADIYDPIRTTSTRMGEVMFMMADTLVSLDFDLKTVKPGLAESWTVSDDGKTYRFVLRKDVKFCDGRPMTAQDVAYSLNRLADPANKSPVRLKVGPIKEVRAVDDYTVDYELSSPFSDTLYQLALPFASIVDKNTVEKLGKNFGTQGFNGTGPYCWVSWTPRQELVLKKNPHYKWGPPIYKNPSPQLDRVIWKVVPESNTLMAAIQSRQGDTSQNVPAFALDGMKKIPGMKVQQQPNAIDDYFLGFRVNKPVTGDLAIRKAVNAAINRDTLVKAIYFGHADPRRSMANPNAVDYDPESVKYLQQYDPAAAAKLLDEAGWKPGPDGVRAKDGVRASFLVYGSRNDTTSRMAETLQADLRRVGIDLQVQLWDNTAVWGKLATQEFDAFIMNLPYITVTEWVNFYFRSVQMPTPNRMNWNNKDTDAYAAQASAALTDAQRQEATSKVQRQLSEQAVWAPLVNVQLWMVSADRVEGARPHGLYGASLYKGLDIRVKN
ncbi:ABC transporter substrate-binding protein [Bordetella petrii]|uniref:ABC transporter substrate-binding protein n=1 Tax=Bordetella petrii TaxID=94624 RepID=UPI00048D06B6|nr:ABC transporter substrate-binding protein [Bordetella petrii]